MGLVPALRDRRAPVRELAVSTLSKLVGKFPPRLGEVPPAPATVAALVAMVKDPREALRAEAIHLLGKFGPVAKAAIPALEAAAKDRDLMRAISAVEALKAIRGAGARDR